MQFEGQILRKQNILNIFECSGWAKAYPDLTTAILNANEQSVDQAFKVFNDQFFSTKEQRKSFYEVVANAESRGEIKTLATLIEKGLANHKVLTILNRTLNSNKLSLTDQADLMQVLSPSNEENLKIIRTLKNITKAYELNKTTINGLLTEEDKQKLTLKASLILNDLATGLGSKDWKHLALVMHDGEESSVQNWALEGVSGDLRALLTIIQEPKFVKDVTYLKNSIDKGMNCSNKSSSREFNINIGQELKHKIDGLKTLDKDAFEKMLLHGLTKYVAFQEFCEEKEKQQGLSSFYEVLKYAFAVLPSNHDFKFLKKLHQVFGEDRFIFLSFLSSNSFSSLRNLLIDLKSDGRDAELVKSLYQVLGELSDEDLRAVANLLSDVSQSRSKAGKWHGSWSKQWTASSEQERTELINFLAVFLQDDLNASETLNFMETILVAFPAFSPAFSESLGREDYQVQIKHVLLALTEDKVQDDLSKFLSNKGLFEFIEILTQEYKAPESSKPQIVQNQRAENTYVTSPQTRESVLTRSCFNEIIKTYDTNTNYYNLVNTLPESCKNVLGDVGFVGQIYLWMNASDAYFKKTYGVTDFHSGTGVWAPGMLQFIFSAAVKADLALRSTSNQAGILLNLDRIHSELTDVRMMETLHQFSNLYATFDKTLNFDARTLNYVNGREDAQLNALTNSAFKILEKTSPVVDYKIKPVSCRDIDPKLGANPCLTKAEVVTYAVDMLRILQRKNENQNSLAKELINWTHPSGGIKLPFRRTTQTIHHVTIEDMVRFLHDLSSDKTSKPFNYQTATASTPVAGTVIDRLEVVIRDIGFLNNFYGAYFKNDVAGATNYRSDVQNSEKLLVLLDTSGGLFRTFGGLPRESKYKLKNIRKTYSSLVEISDQYPQANGTTRDYSSFIQSLLAAIANSSKLSTQAFTPYRVPGPGIVDGHNGVFLTKFVEMSGLRHLSVFLRARLDDELSALNSSGFKLINKNLIARHDVVKLQTAVQTVLDKYLDHDRNQINLIVKDGMNFLYSLDDREDQKALEQIVLKGAMLLSSELVSTANIQKLAESMEILIEMYPEVSEILKGVSDKKSLLRLVNKFMDNLVDHPEEVESLMSEMVSSELFGAKDLKLLLQDQDFRVKAKDFLNQLTTLEDFDSELNWSEVLKAIFSSDMQWESLKSWFKSSLGEDDKKLTVSLLLSFLGEKENGAYRIKEILDETLVNHRQELEQFLRETFKALELKTE